MTVKMSSPSSLRIMALSSTIKDLSRIEEYSEVGINDYGISDKPLVSFVYLHCGAVILKKGRFAGLSHFWSNKDPGGFIDQMTDKMGGEYAGLKAIIMTAEADDRFADACQSRSIPILGRYTKDCGGADGKQKDIIVKPSVNEVLFYTSKGTIRKTF